MLGFKKLFKPEKNILENTYYGILVGLSLNDVTMVN